MKHVLQKHDSNTYIIKTMCKNRNCYLTAGASLECFIVIKLLPDSISPHLILKIPREVCPIPPSNCKSMLCILNVLYTLGNPHINIVYMQGLLCPSNFSWFFICPYLQVRSYIQLSGPTLGITGIDLGDPLGLTCKMTWLLVYNYLCI